MKTAVIFNGQVRTLARCFESQRWNVYRKLVDPHFFISVADEPNAREVERVRAIYAADRVFIEYVHQPRLPEPPAIHTQHVPYFDNPNKYRAEGLTLGEGLMRCLWSLNRSWEFFAESVDPSQFAEVVLMRGDLYFQNWIPPAVPIGEDEAFVPWWASYGGVNGSSGVFGINAARAYLTAFQQLQPMLDAGCPFHPESLVCFAMERAGCKIHRTLWSEFDFVRMDGRIDHPNILLPEVARYAAALVMERFKQ